MKNTNLEPRIVRLRFYTPGDGERVWTAMKIAFQSLLFLGAGWIIATALFSS